MNEIPVFETDGDAVYSPPALRNLTEAQERLLQQCAILAQAATRLEVWWVNGKMHVQLIKTEDRRRA
jgi:hypothetical protein